MDLEAFTDLSFTRRGLEQGTSDREPIDLSLERGDLRLVSGRENLAQAILNRLLAHQGALASLGHPAYGSRLHELAGEPHTGRTRALAELFVREALALEPRVAEVVAVESAAPDPARRGFLDLRVVVRPAGERELLSVSTVVSLEA